MENRNYMLKVVMYICTTLLMSGIITFSFGMFVNGYSSAVFVSIGICISAVFIFLMGIFFTATEEMLQKIQS